MKHLRGGIRLKITITEHDQSGMDRAMNAYPVADDTSRVRLLFYEQDEGGAGLLHNLTDASAWERLGGTKGHPSDHGFLHSRA